jgi:membrane-bound lytic murein transglycosylase D
MNYNSLQSWPLAVTAYNHGRAGMMRAIKRVGTRDIVEIIAKYKSPTFGFASKNFYAEFLGALEVEVEYEKYFGKVETEAPLKFDAVELEHYISLAPIIQYTGVSKKIIKRYNPGLTYYVLAGKKRIPKGYELKLPFGEKASFLAAYKKIPQKYTHRAQRRFVYHKVRKGDTLSYLASRYRTSVSRIRSANRLGRFIYAGQTLVIPR